MAEGRTARVIELDVLRGIAIAGMIIVNTPGDWGHVYAPLLHAPWHGWTVTDMVFPTFLFVVGMALGVSFPRPLDTGQLRTAYWTRVVRRAVALVVLGLLLNWTYVLAVQWGSPPTGPTDEPTLRLPGVLQRIAFCYLLAAIIIVATGRREEDGRTDIRSIAIWLTIAAVLVGYWALLSLVPAPGFAAGDLSKAGSLPAYVDRQLFTPEHLWAMGSESWRGPVVFDPEGLLSSLPATANVLFGVLAGREWRRRGGARLRWVAAVSVALLLAGLLLDPLFPINKSLWTSSFVLLSSGFSGLLLVAVAIAMRARAADRMAAPLKILGGNAVLAYAISTVIGAFSGIPLGASEMTAQGWGNGLALSLVGDPYLASLAYALAILLLIILLLWPLHRRGLHLRV